MPTTEIILYNILKVGTVLKDSIDRLDPRIALVVVERKAK